MRRQSIQEELKTKDPLDVLRGRETPDRSLRWFQDMLRQLGLSNLTATKAMKTGLGELENSIEIGNMYLYLYDPKYKNSLPYYDTAPLVIPFDETPGGWLGLNLHYLSPMMRLALLRKLMEYTNNKHLTDDTKFRLKWKLLKNASKFPGVKACVKRYLKSHTRSRFLKINPQDWEKSVVLSLEQFVKASRLKVFRDSRNK